MMNCSVESRTGLNAKKQIAKQIVNYLADNKLNYLDERFVGHIYGNARQGKQGLFKLPKRLSLLVDKHHPLMGYNTWFSK
jgi:hypothetical protein